MATTFIKKIFTFFLVALITVITTLGVVITIMVHDPLVINFVEDQICQQASSAFACNFKASITHIDIAKGQLLLGNVIVSPWNAENNWSWACDAITLDISWLALITEQKIVFKTTCGNMHALSRIVDGQPMIARHIQMFMQQKQQALPIILEKLHLQHAECTLIFDNQESMTFVLTGAADLINGRLHSGVTFMQESLVYKGNTLIKI